MFGPSAVPLKAAEVVQCRQRTKSANTETRGRWLARPSARKITGRRSLPTEECGRRNAPTSVLVAPVVWECWLAPFVVAAEGGGKATGTADAVVPDAGCRPLSSSSTGGRWAM